MPAERVESVFPQATEITRQNLQHIGYGALRLTAAQALGNVLHKQPEKEAAEDGLVQSPRTHALVEGISADLALAYEGIQGEGKGEDVSHTALLERALGIQHGRIMAAKKAGRSIGPALERYLATVGLYALENTSYDYYGRLQDPLLKAREIVTNSLIKEGVSEELIEAARSTYGIVLNKKAAGSYIENYEPEKNMELSSLVNADLLSAGLGKKVSFDPEEPALAKPDYYEHKEMLSGLGLEDLAAAALVARQQMAKPKAEGPAATSRRRDLTELCIKRINDSLVWREDRSNYLDYDEMIKSLRMIAKADPALAKRGAEEIFHKIKQGRKIGYYYRINDMEINNVDSAVRHLQDKDDPEYDETAASLARRMDFDERTLEIIHEHRMDTYKLLLNLDQYPDFDPDAIDSLIYDCLNNNRYVELLAAIPKLPHQHVNYLELVRELGREDVSRGTYYLDLFFEKVEGMDLPIGQAAQGAEGLRRIKEGYEFIKNNTSIMEIFGRGGPGYAFSGKIFGELFQLIDTPDQMIALAKSISSKFTGDSSTWFIAWQIAKDKLGEIGEVGYQEGLRITEIPATMPDKHLRNGTLFGQYQQLKPKKIAEMDLEEKRMYLGVGDDVSDDELQRLTKDGSVDFSQLGSEIKDRLFAYRLFEAVALSGSKQARTEATERNKTVADRANWWQEDDLVHATRSPATLRVIFKNGALCGESIGFESQRDSYPMNLDAVAVTQAILDEKSHESRLANLGNAWYGKICLVFDRGPGALHRGEEFKGGMVDNHRLLLGGLPSTEVKAILLRDSPDSEMVNEVISAVVDNGQYIPVINPSGELILSYEQYEALRQQPPAVSFSEELNHLSALEVRAALFNRQSLVENFGPSIEKLKAELDQPKVDAWEIVNLLGGSSKSMERLLASNTGVSEGYKLFEHTQAVLNNFETYFAGSLTPEQRKLVRTALMLQDIGKTLWNIESKSGQQSTYNALVSDNITSALEFSSPERNILRSLIAHDSVGEAIQKPSQESQAQLRSQITQVAGALGVSAQEALNVMTIMYTCDAGAYTAQAKYLDARGQPKNAQGALDNLFEWSGDTMRLKPEIAQRLQLALA